MRVHIEERRRLLKRTMIAGGIILAAVIIWIDIATGLWQEVVIISGLAAGLVSFLLTALVLNRIIARESEQRWAPVNRLAITEFLHAIADDDRSEIAHGVVVPRSIPAPSQVFDAPSFVAELHALRETVAKERHDLSESLSRWADFLTTSGDNEVVLQHVARIAFQLDEVRDAALELEQAPSEAGAKALEREITECNERFVALVTELKARIAVLDQREGRVVA